MTIISMSKPTKPTEGVEITYADAAHIVGVSERAIRDVLTKYRKQCPPIKYGYRSVRFDLGNVLTVKQLRRDAALKGARK